MADFAVVRADNPGPFTLTGTNTYVVGRDPCWIVDPGPALPDHIRAVRDEASRRGGAAGVALTHHHADHAAAVEAFGDVPSDPGPLETVPTPGHTPDHVAYVWERIAFTGDAVLGEGSVFVVGQLGTYLDALAGLRDRGLEVLCPGHGPLVEDPAARLDELIAHRLDRERRLVEALEAGLRRVDDLLDRVWDDAPDVLRLASAVTLGAHLEKLEAEDRLPPGVERPEVPTDLRAP
jgi:glyoxylase-like metal-dependent hydrolase (beta-lactamase superfamily II)